MSITPQRYIIILTRRKIMQLFLEKSKKSHIFTPVRLFCHRNATKEKTPARKEYAATEI